ncbi:hypothetical protein CANCADRAFT_45200 [Tortispora caseinolytica NRRL Y-17796]|uniref:Rrp15p-domain-containing protein n=1 Tax=Tortispora caseinolytica NRRL Y-17796 TaxID=767744 RepID=A0A1E4TAC0_9ASCO|nr:hypothetical protein CANCADRAFT_45200 [Tortispora caseinolytica NRRL Y-17796]
MGQERKRRKQDNGNGKPKKSVTFATDLNGPETSLNDNSKRDREDEDEPGGVLNETEASAEGSDASDGEVDEESEGEVESEDDEAKESSDESESESDLEDYNSMMKTKAPKKNNSKESFSNAFSSLVSSHIKAHNRENPILIRSNAVAKLESQKMELKARRLLKLEEKQKKNRGHVSDLTYWYYNEDNNDTNGFEYEKVLKKTAQRGAVKLFNAVMAAQLRMTGASTKDIRGTDKRKEVLTDLSKQSFLEMVKNS